MRRSFCSSARIRSTSFDGNAGSERQSTRIRTVSAAVSRVHRPWKERTSSPFRNSRVAPIPSRRSASFAAPIRRVPLSNNRDVNSATPKSLPSAATPAGTVPRIAMNGFEGSATDRRIAPFSRTVRSGRFTGGPPAHGTGRRSGAPRRDTGGRPRGPAPAGLSRSSRGAPPEVPRAEAFARAEQHALEGDAVLLVPRPRADLLVGPREFRLRRGRPLQLLDFSVEHGLDAVQGGAGRQRRGRDEQGGVQLRLEADPDVRRELRVDEGPVQSVRSGPPVARRERDEFPPPAEDRREEDERRRVLLGLD